MDRFQVHGEVAACMDSLLVSYYFLIRANKKLMALHNVFIILLRFGSIFHPPPPRRAGLRRDFVVFLSYYL